MDRDVDETTIQDQIEDLLRQAEDCARAGDAQSARQIWEAVLQIDPQNPRAQEELQLASVLHQDWPWTEEATPESPVPAAQMAQVREWLDAGMIEQAFRAASELAKDHGHDPAVQALVEQVRQARERAPMVAQAVEEARAGLAAGDRARALLACQRVLDLEPGNREAEMIFEQAELLPAEPAEGDTQGSMSLDLELDLALAKSLSPSPKEKLPPPSAPRPGPPPATETDTAPAINTAAHRTIEIDPSLLRDLAGSANVPFQRDDDPTTVRDLLEAADDLDAEPPEAEPSGSMEMPSATTPSEGEAALLVARAQQALEQKDLTKASDLAGQALTLAPDTPGAQEVLEAVRRAGERRLAEADTLLSEGSQALESGKTEEAIASFEKALECVPGHPEARELLERARREHEKKAGTPGAEPSPHPFEDDLDAVMSIPLAGAASPGPVTSPPLPGPLGGPHLGPEIPTLGSSQPDLPKMAGGPAGLKDAVPSCSQASSMGVPAVPAMGSAPAAPAPGVAPARASAALSAGKKLQAGGFLGKIIGFVFAAVRRYLIRLAILLVISVVGLGVRVGGSFLGWWGQEDTPSSQTTASVPSGSKKPLPKPQADSGPATTPGASTPAPAESRYKREEVPGLMQKAREMLNQGDPQGAIDLLTKAQEADPLNFEVIDRLEQARVALKARQEEDSRLRTVRDSFTAGDYEEALRILYRLPKNQQPPHLERWQANGWYNLAVLRLQTGDLAEANEYFNECLQLTPNDKEARQGKELVRRYRGKTLDATYRRIVENLELRSMDER